MAEKSVITNIENRIRQLMDDHKRLSDQCAELTTEGLAGGSRNRDKARARVNRLMREVDKCIALLGRPE